MCSYFDRQWVRNDGNRWQQLAVMHGWPQEAYHSSPLSPLPCINTRNYWEAHSLLQVQPDHTELIPYTQHSQYKSPLHDLWVADCQLNCLRISRVTVQGQHQREPAWRTLAASSCILTTPEDNTSTLLRPGSRSCCNNTDKPEQSL